MNAAILKPLPQIKHTISINKISNQMGQIEYICIYTKIYFNFQTRIKRKSKTTIKK